MGVDMAQLQRLIEAFEQSDWDEVHLRGEDFEIRLSTKADDDAPSVAAAAPGAAPATGATPAAAATADAPDNGGAPGPAEGATASAPADTPARAPAAAGAQDGAAEPAPASSPAAVAEGEPVLSPSVGIFWRAPSPTSPPFVEVGDAITPESTLCIVEVMKLMTQVGAGRSGRVVDILVANGEPVQKDQPLFLVAPE